MQSKLDMNIDAVVMLTSSDWKTELRSNRYHYATRFAEHYPVIFVQPDQPKENYYFESTEIENIEILHVYQNCCPLQTDIINRALKEKYIISPLLWVYSPKFIHFIENSYSTFSIYHATEDYFAEDSPARYSPDGFLHRSLTKCLQYVDLIVCVSDGVRENLVENCRMPDKIHVVSNGCDYEFYTNTLDKSQLETMLSSSENETFLQALNEAEANQDKNIAFYQGNIYDKLDYELLIQLASKMTNWEFHFCGPVILKDRLWTKLKGLPNVKWLGCLTPEELREYAHRCTVGLIPFRRMDFLTKRSFPLKAFEYLACGLPVVTTPIDALKPFEPLFLFSEGVAEFEAGLEKAAAVKDNPEHAEGRLLAAEQQSYSHKFHKVLQHINERYSEYVANPMHKKLNVAYLYDVKSTHTSTVLDYLDSFSNYSRHNIYLTPATNDFDTSIDIDMFDVIVLHYSLRMYLDSGSSVLSDTMREKIKASSKFKALFIQDEYDHVNVTKKNIKEFGINVVFTCVPEPYVDFVYPHDEFPGVDFISILTGYVPDHLEHNKAKSLRNRKPLIAYRGRNLPFWYGDLGQEKQNIGVKMREICDARGLPVDIEWTEEKRIYGPGWHDFLASAKATLGTESGSNLFDFTGEFREKTEAYLSRHPKANYETVRDEVFGEAEKNSKIKMNQISPKIFEAVSLGTALVLFEGSYSNVVKPNEHFIPLKKDFSNIDDVLEKLQDDDYLTEMTENAYNHVIKSGKYSYKQFVKMFDDTLNTKIRHPVKVKILSAIIGYSIPGYESDSKKDLFYNFISARKAFSLGEIHNSTLEDFFLEGVVKECPKSLKQQWPMAKRIFSNRRLRNLYNQLYYRFSFMRPMLAFFKRVVVARVFTA
jgi:glycosyltransferase involved in cell wall biosynthesis